MGRRLLYLAVLVETAAAQTVGDIKLVNGRTAGAYDGLIQVYYNSAWYSVCDDNFADEHAELVCQQLFGTGWVSWTNDNGHCYTPVTGPILDLEYTYSRTTWTGTTLYDHVDGSTTDCDHDEDVSVVCAFDTSASTMDQTLDLSCVPGDCAPGYKQCGDSWTWCCGDDHPTPTAATAMAGVKTARRRRRSRLRRACSLVFSAPLSVPLCSPSSPAASAAPAVPCIASARRRWSSRRRRHRRRFRWSRCPPSSPRRELGPRASYAQRPPF